LPSKLQLVALWVPKDVFWCFLYIIDWYYIDIECNWSFFFMDLIDSILDVF
jgi:hypothetical protein